MRQAVYRLQTDARVLVIGPGGGFDIASARYYGHRQITGVEINPIIIRLVRDRFQSFTGNLYGQDGVQIVHDEGRSFVRRSQEQYDVIQLTLVDTWAATGAGWLALSENILYTAEAFEDYLRHITEGGMVSVNRWMFPGADRETLRVVSLGLEALRQLGTPEPAQHFLVWRNRVVLPGQSAQEPQHFSLGTVLIKRSAFTEQEIQTIETLCAQATECAMVYAPGRHLQNPFTTLLQTSDQAQFYATYPFWVDPTTDDRPFFFYTLKPSQVLTTLSQTFFRTLTPDVTNIGLFLLVNSIMITVGLTLAAVFLPLWLLSRRQSREGWGIPIGYFFCLGLGFMLIEIAMLQRFTLLLSYPVYSLAVTLAALLVFSGCGSLLSNRFSTDVQARRPELVFVGIGILGMLYAWLLPLLFDWALPFTLPVRIALGVFLLLPMGLLLGIPFPIGIRRLERRQDELIPWAWASNGGASVLGASLAMIVALHVGFTVVLIGGAICYLLAWSLFHQWGASH